MSKEFFVYRDECPIDQQCIHVLRWVDVILCLSEIRLRACREWGWPCGAHFVLNQSDDHGTFTVCRGNVTHNGKILIEP